MKATNISINYENTKRKFSIDRWFFYIIIVPLSVADAMKAFK